MEEGEEAVRGVGTKVEGFECGCGGFYKRAEGGGRVVGRVAADEEVSQSEGRGELICIVGEGGLDVEGGDVCQRAISRGGRERGREREGVLVPARDGSSIHSDPKSESPTSTSSLTPTTRRRTWYAGDRAASTDAREALAYASHSSSLTRTHGRPYACNVACKSKGGSPVKAKTRGAGGGRLSSASSSIRTVRYLPRAGLSRMACTDPLPLPFASISRHIRAGAGACHRGAMRLAAASDLNGRYG